MEHLDAKGPCFDSLRLSPRERADVIAQLEKQQNSSGGAGDKRVDQRFQYQVEAGVIVKVHHPGGSTVNYVVRSRNLSNTGIAFLHGSFLYPSTQCVLVLKTVDNQAVRVEGVVTRCEHVRGHIHDVGVRFAGPIKAGGFVTNPAAGATAAPPTPSAELPSLTGKVLYVEDSVSEQELLKFHLTSVGVEMQVAANGMAALDAAARTKFDAVITNVWLPGMSGGEVAECLRSTGFKGPIIALTSDDRQDARVEALERGCDHLLLKPYKIEVLAKLLAKHLPAGGDAASAEAPLVSELWPNESMRPLIRGFLGRLENQASEIARCVETEGAVELLQKLCLDVKGSAGGYGFPTISDSANRLLKLTMNTPAIDALKQQCDELTRLCHTACRELAAKPDAPGTTPAGAPAPSSEAATPAPAKAPAKS